MIKELSPVIRSGARTLLRRLIFSIGTGDQVTPEQLLKYLAREDLVSRDDQEQVLKLAAAECLYWEQEFLLVHAEALGDPESEAASKYERYTEAGFVLHDSLDQIRERTAAELEAEITRLMEDDSDWSQDAVFILRIGPATTKSVAELRADIDLIGDGLGYPIDTGIKETVVGLMANDVPTRASCEGHLGRGLPVPWVDVAYPEPEGEETDDQDAKAAAWMALNQSAYARLDQLLEEFYAQRSSDVRIGYEVWGHSARLMPVPFDKYRDRTDLLAPAQAEMSEFARFLIERAQAR